MTWALHTGLWALLLVALGCEAEAPGPVPSEPPTREAAPEPGPVARPSRPGDGSALRYEGGLVWVEASAADPRRVLWDLSEQAGFLLEVTDLDGTPVSLHFEGAPLGDVVAAVARQLPFALDYEPEGSTGRHVLVSVRVGRTPEVVHAAPRPAPAPEAPRRERRSPDHERLLRELGIANVEARRELIEGLDATGVELDVLSHVMESDPDPELRSMAADTLATAGSYGAVRNLIAALDSDDSDVILLAIEALEFAGDDSIVPNLEPLFDHPDPAVRDAAREAAEFLR